MEKTLKKFWGKLHDVMQQKLVRRLLYAGIVLLSLAFIGYLIHTNWAQLANHQWQFNIIYLVLSTVLYPLGMFPTVAAWHWLLRAFQVNKSSTLNLRLYALSSLPRHIPGLVWYVTSRSLLYEEQAVRVSITLAATALETAFLALTGVITALIIIPLKTALPPQFAIVRYLFPVSVITLLVIIIWVQWGSKPIDKLLKHLHVVQEGEKIDRRALFISIIWMFGAWVGGGMLLWILVRGITPIRIDLLPLMIGIWGLAGAVSLTIGVGIQGFGLREVTLGALMSTGISPIEAITAAIAFRLTLTIGELIWVFLISILIKPKPIELIEDRNSQ